MIGVLAKPEYGPAVFEFFELFKTPWEPYCEEHGYSVVLCVGSPAPRVRNSTVLIEYLCHAGKVESDLPPDHFNKFLYKNRELPIYGDHQTFEAGSGALVEAETGRSALKVVETENVRTVRIGYDLYYETEFLLRQGQPCASAHAPTLDLHIAILRDLIVNLTGWLVEIPPVPDGSRFIACLTHDVDNPSLRLHHFDHTAAGFLYRACVGSFKNLLRRRTSLPDAVRNWLAAASFPLVQLGLLPDPWEKCVDYGQLEQAPSTFFFIPFADKPGQLRDGEHAPDFRASRYGIAQVAPLVEKLLEQGREIALHGIDAWRDAEIALREFQQIREVTGKVSSRETGIRMHWLYYAPESPTILESAGATYDSTVGYNNTFGYRSGTTQVYRPLGAKQLLELPLHLMDTALFYPSYLNLSDSQAREKLQPMFEHAIQAGGVITINWHDRSIAPERQWGGFYQHLLEKSRECGGWLTNASEAVAWFRLRRHATFVRSAQDPDQVELVWPARISNEGLPALRIRTYRCASIHDMHLVAGESRTVGAAARGRHSSHLS